MIYLNLFQFQIFGQATKPCSILFSPVYGQEKLSFENRNYPIESGNNLQFSTLKFYISKLQLVNNEDIVWEEKNSYHLIDASNEKSLLFALDLPDHLQFNKVQFQLGIDSNTNVSGAMGGDLDPSKGMYWAWQSGYINTKIEGKSSSCKTRNNEFQFHIGGYLQPYYAMRQMKFDWGKKADDDISIGIDLNLFFSNLELKENNSVMIPGKEAMKLANDSTKMFYAQ